MPPRRKTSPESRWSQLRHELGRSLWMLPLLAGLLTLLMIRGDASVTKIAWSFFSNLVIAAGIGGTITTLYVVGPPQIWPSPDGTPGPGASQLQRVWWAWLVHAATIAVGVVVGTELALLVLRPLIATDNLAAIRFGIWQVGAVVSIAMVIIGITYDRLRGHARRTELKAEHATQALLRAQLDNLQARLNPHFLFNSLNTVAALIEEDPARAVTAVERLSELLRYGLEGTKHDAVPLRRELEAVESFLEIERLRYGERLRWTVDAAQGTHAVEVPPLLLQPLVENAVRHGVAARREGGSVTVTARLQQGRLVIEVLDDGPGTGTEGGTGLGAATVRERLALAFGEDASFEAGPRASGGYAVTIEIAVGADPGVPREPAPSAREASA